MKKVEKTFSTDEVGQILSNIRPELCGYLQKMTLDPALAEDLYQNTAVRALEAIKHSPQKTSEIRPWLFRIASNLAIDELRRRKRLKEDLILDVERFAKNSVRYRDKASSLRGNPSMIFVAREHLAACLSCVLRSLSPKEAATLLLREVYLFRLSEVAKILDARENQVKNWLQQARTYLQKRYEGMCTLVNKKGVCYQCEELSEQFTGKRTDPLLGTDRSISARFQILQSDCKLPPGPWHSLFSHLIKNLQESF